jgi:ribosome-binding factor A
MAAPQWTNERAKEQLYREISWVIANSLRDPRIPSIVTVTDLKLAPDKRNATVFVSVFGDEKEQKSAMIALDRAAPFIQRMVAERVTFKHFPRLVFKQDHAQKHAEHINELLGKVKDDLV